MVEEDAELFGPNSYFPSSLLLHHGDQNGPNNGIGGGILLEQEQTDVIDVEYDEIQDLEAPVDAHDAVGDYKEVLLSVQDVIEHLSSSHCRLNNLMRVLPVASDIAGTVSPFDD